ADIPRDVLARPVDLREKLREDRKAVELPVELRLEELRQRRQDVLQKLRRHLLLKSLRDERRKRRKLRSADGHGALAGERVAELHRELAIGHAAVRALVGFRPRAALRRGLVAAAGGAARRAEALGVIALEPALEAGREIDLLAVVVAE